MTAFALFTSLAVPDEPADPADPEPPYVQQLRDLEPEDLARIRACIAALRNLREQTSLPPIVLPTPQSYEQN